MGTHLKWVNTDCVTVKTQETSVRFVIIVLQLLQSVYELIFRLKFSPLSAVTSHRPLSALSGISYRVSSNLAPLLSNVHLIPVYCESGKRAVQRLRESVIPCDMH